MKVNSTITLVVEYVIFCLFSFKLYHTFLLLGF